MTKTIKITKMDKISTESNIKGSVYFTANILAATDRLELLCRQLNICSRGMMQFK